MRLGEVLIAEGALDPKRLKEALDAQLRYGGHLGTCLVECGFVSEEILGQALAKAFGVPLAPAAAFQNIPPDVIALLPLKTVEKHSVIPLRLKDKSLDVAMINPKDLPALDECQFVSGRSIRCWVAPEIRIVEAMERYYQVPRRIRFVALGRTLEKEKPISIAVTPSILPEEGMLITAPSARPVAAAAPDTLVAVSELLCSATTEDQIAQLVLDALHGEIPRRILFKVQGDNAYVWRSAGAGIDPAASKMVLFPILSESVFGLLRGEDHFAGPLPEGRAHHGFYEKLGIELPAHILVLAVHLEDQLIAMFYGDGGRDGVVGGNVEKHRRLLTKAALAIHVVQTKAKLRSV